MYIYKGTSLVVSIRWGRCPTIELSDPQTGKTDTTGEHTKSRITILNNREFTLERPLTTIRMRLYI
jgi:hypothetical protein